MARGKTTTLEVDEATLVPMLKQMDRVREVPTLLQMAGDFLKSCRFAPEKVEVLQREIQNKTDAKSIQLFCWNVLLSGQGQAVLKW
ncbi:hypothetical protein D3C75_343280 [compost metagenome]